ncbi:DUF1513 domain-containing protein [Vannielia litorea]|uniref:DUF1513 domain-containing protein n=1 Tax=Vannielia litorea TaxID=1217970 RepID=A0A1N6GCS6_9RHOB|nr:DUF1513 domain-containing protein [Vannielia litorea]SIO05323.1 hypothetical protein SAMN05444002_2381 [Vannielia litorea]
MIPRRAFLASLAAAAALPRASWADAGAPAFLAAARAPSGAFTLCGLSAAGALRFRLPLPDRGHAAAAHPTRPEAVAFARRPGRFAVVIDCASGRQTARLDAPEGRHFQGHGAFLEGGTVLATSENDFATGAGVIGLWAPDEGYTRIGELPSGGIGPHELLTLPDDRSLLVANGGLRTEEGSREVLNLDTMRPNLAVVTPDRGVRELAELPEALWPNSIRHLALRPDGRAGFAMQWQGDPSEAVPLLGLWQAGAPLRLCEPPPARALAMRGYAGSVAFSGDGQALAITSPRGGEVQLFDAETATLTAHWRRPDICGLAPLGAGFLASDGMGGLFALATDGSATPLARHEAAWDNHLVPVRPA